MGMRTRGHGLLFRPAQKLVRRDGRLFDLACLLVHELHPLGQFGRMGQEERQIEGSCRIKDTPGCFQVASLLGISPTLLPAPQLKL
jgi:hypothetical protein